MLVIARALIHRPELLLLDEPSLGLAPKLVQDIFETLVEINRKEDITMIVADQNAKRTLQIADYGYVLENGQIELQDPAETLMNREGDQGVLPRNQPRGRPVHGHQTLQDTQTMDLIPEYE